MAENQDKPSVTTQSLRDFKLTRVLFNDASKKKISLLGFIPSSAGESQAIVFIEKVEFSEEKFTTDDGDKAFLKQITLETTLMNDIYADFAGLIDPRLNELKVSTIYPATEQHVNKYSSQDFFLYLETPEMYETLILPFIQKAQFSIEWVYNVLEGKKEVDRILFKDLDPVTGFLLAKDFKWNSQIESLHVTALVMDRTIKSLRDLNASHLPLLENIRSNSLATIKSEFGLDESKIRAYFHYQPSYYHLHVHFTYLRFDAPGTHCERAHMLDTVISNIKIASDYYKKATLPFTVGEKSKMYLAIKEAQAEKQAKT